MSKKLIIAVLAMFSAAALPMADAMARPHCGPHHTWRNHRCYANGPHRAYHHDHHDHDGHYDHR